MNFGGCSNCGKPLSDPKSVKRGMGPDCYRKFKFEEAKRKTSLKAGDLDKERDILNFILDLQKNKGLLYQYRDFEEGEEELTKQGFRWIKDFAYHSYDYLKQRINVNLPTNEIAVIVDDQDYGDHTQLVISLFFKEKPLETYFEESAEVES